MTPLEQLIYDFCKKNHTFTLLDTDEAREYTEEKAKELAGLVGDHFKPASCNHNFAPLNSLEFGGNTLAESNDAICIKCGYQPNAIDSHRDILMPGSFSIPKEKFHLENHEEKPTADYNYTISFDPKALALPNLDMHGYIYSDDNYKNLNPPSQRVYDNAGFQVLDFTHVKGGFCLLKDMVKIDTLNERLKQLFPTLHNETVVRLAHKGIFPIKSTGGYIYFTDKEDKLIGTSEPDELGKLLIQMHPKENKRLKRAERAELKCFNLI